MILCLFEQPQMFAQIHQRRVGIVELNRQIAIAIPFRALDQVPLAVSQHPGQVYGAVLSQIIRILSPGLLCEPQQYLVGAHFELGQAGLDHSLNSNIC